MATTEDPVLIARMQDEEFVGQRVWVDNNGLMP